MHIPALSPPAKLSHLNWPRGLVVTLALLAIFTPLSLIFFQSFYQHHFLLRSSNSPLTPTVSFLMIPIFGMRSGMA